MAAVVRGRGGAAPKGATTKPQSRPRGKSAAHAAPAYAPGKLTAAEVLPPRIAVIATAFLLALGLLLAAVTGDRPAKIAAAARGGVAETMAMFGFKLRRVHIQGVPDVARIDILKAAGLYKNQPILGVDLDAMRKTVETVGWVKEARIVRLLPDTMVIVVTPRPVLAVWQHGAQLQVIDDQGQVIREADAAMFPELPLVVGAGANEAAGVVLPVLRARPQLMERTEALVRVDGRRWDLRLKDGSLIQLPAVGEDSALIQLDQLDQRSRLLQLGFERIDLRDAESIAVRPRNQSALTAPIVVGG